MAICDNLTLDVPMLGCCSAAPPHVVGGEYVMHRTLLSGGSSPIFNVLHQRNEIKRYQNAICILQSAGDTDNWYQLDLNWPGPPQFPANFTITTGPTWSAPGSLIFQSNDVISDTQLLQTYNTGAWTWDVNFTDPLTFQDDYNAIEPSMKALVNFPITPEPNYSLDRRKVDRYDFNGVGWVFSDNVLVVGKGEGSRFESKGDYHTQPNAAWLTFAAGSVLPIPQIFMEWNILRRKLEAQDGGTYCKYGYGTTEWDGNNFRIERSCQTSLFNAGDIIEAEVGFIPDDYLNNTTNATFRGRVRTALLPSDQVPGNQDPPCCNQAP